MCVSILIKIGIETSIPEAAMPRLKEENLPCARDQ